MLVKRQERLLFSVLISTHNPRQEYLRRTLEALAGQTLDREKWELVVVDNKSEEPLNLFEGEKVQRSESVVGGGSRVAGPSSLQTSQTREELRRVEDGAAGYGLQATRKTEVGGRESFLNVRIVREEKLGLTHARVRGFEEAKGEIVVMVDDDNVLRPDYLEKAVEILDKNPLLGAIGGKALPEYEIEPPEWLKGIRSGLGLRDLGSSEILYPVTKEQGEVEGERWKAEKGIGDCGLAPEHPPLAFSKVASGLAENSVTRKELGIGGTKDNKGSINRVRRRMTEFPDCAPIGAGMVIRREAALEYVARIKEILGEGVAGGGSRVAGPSSLQTSPTREELRRVSGSDAKKAVVTDRKGKSLSSGGDNDICLTVLEHGWQVGYFPQLELTHLIPKERMTVEYQSRMARDAMRSFIVMLDQHGIRPWPAMARWTLPLRVAADWWRVKAWQGTEQRLKFWGHVGMYEGRAALVPPRSKELSQQQQDIPGLA